MKQPNSERLWTARSRQWQALCLALLLLLMAAILAAPESYSQDGGQATNNEAPLLAEPPPNPEPQGPATPGDAGAGEVIHIAEVTIDSAEDAARLLELGYRCAEGAPCEIEVTEAELGRIEDAGLSVGVVGVVVTSEMQEAEAEEPYRYADIYDDLNIQEIPTSAYALQISGAPDAAAVTRVKYSCRLVNQGFGGPTDYRLEICHSGCYRIWNQQGAWHGYFSTDGGYDDDPEDDADVYLEERAILSHFDGQPVNGVWTLVADDRVINGSRGYMDYWKLWVYYCTGGPYEPTLIAPAHQSHTCDTTPTFDWSDLSTAKQYWIEVDDGLNFKFPEISSGTGVSSYTPGSALPPGHYYWRVRGRNECGWGSWSAPKEFTIDRAVVPQLQSPAEGDRTCDLTPTFTWTAASRPTTYRIQASTRTYFPADWLVINTTTSVPNYTPPTALTSGVRYYWRVREEGACGIGDYSAVRHFDIVGQASPPALLSPGDGAHTCDATPEFDWSTVSGASSYWLDVDNDSSFSSPEIHANPSGSSYAPSAPLAPGTYYWHVKASVPGCGTTGWSDVRRVVIDPRPATPTGPAPADGATGVALEADLDWADAARATSYDVYFGTSSVPPFVANVSSSQHALPTLSPNTRYYWKVVANNSCGNAEGPVWSFTTGGGPCTPPATPAGPSPGDGATGVGLDADLSWAHTAAATSYDIYFGTSSVPPFVANVSSSQHALPTLSPNTRYYWKVVANNSCGSTSGPLWTFATEGAGTFDTVVCLPIVLKRSLGNLAIALGQHNIQHGLSLDEGGDVDTEVVWVGSPELSWARSTGNGQSLPSANGNDISDYYLQLHADDGLFYAGWPTTRVRVEVEYFDQGSDTFELQYDAVSGGPFGDGRFKGAGLVTKSNSGRFRTASFDLNDAYFANRDNGADLRINDYGDGAEVIRRVIVTLLAP